MTDWHGTAQLSASGESEVAWRLPRRVETVIGRADGSGIRLQGGWIPNHVAILYPERFGWRLENGRSTRLSASGPGVRGARFEPGGVVALGRGEWVLAWDLDSPLHAHVTISNAPPVGQLPWALSRMVPTDGGRQLTAYVAERTMFSPAELHLLAVLFAHEFNQESPPGNLCEEAAQRLGRTTSQVKNSANTVRRRVNRKRLARQIETLEELGFYLVHTAQAISPDDLEP